MLTQLTRRKLFLLPAKIVPLTVRKISTCQTVLVLLIPSQHLNFFMEMTLLKSALLPLRVTEFQLARCDPSELLSAAHAHRVTLLSSLCSCIWVELAKIALSNLRLSSPFSNSMTSRISRLLKSSQAHLAAMLGPQKRAMPMHWLCTELFSAWETTSDINGGLLLG